MISRRQLNTAFMRYLVVGGLAFASEYASFLLLYKVAGVELLPANGLSFCIGLLASFSLNRLWTFAIKEYQRKIAHQFGYYVSLAIFNLIATILIVDILNILGLEPTIGKLVAMAITSSWNFLIFKLFIFKHAQIEL